MVILTAIIGAIMFGFTDQLDNSGSANAAFELNEQSGTITPIQTEDETEYDVIVDGSKTKTIPGNSVGKAIQIDNASSGSTIQIVNPQTGQVVKEWEIDDETNIGNNNGENNGNTGSGGNGLVLTVDTTNSGSTNDKSFLIDAGVSNAGSYNVNWSDGNVKGANGETTISWNSSGTYQVEITGNYTHPAFLDQSAISNSQDAPKIESIDQWGDIQYDSMYLSFAGTSNINYNASDNPDFSDVENMERMLYESSISNADLSSWDTSSVTDMSRMFEDASSFNGDISGWDTSSVTTMRGMFSTANSFNQDLNSWNTGSVTDMYRMFYAADSFNGDISGWDTSSVTNMENMFTYADSFNQDLNSWDTSNLETMKGMFQEAPIFNGSISAWNTSNVRNMKVMFSNAGSFNQDISSWCVSQISSKPFDFDNRAGFEGETSKQPDWGASC